MPALAPPKSTDLRDELERYLTSDIENVRDALSWWHERRTTYPHLSRMALDYLTIPGEFFFKLNSHILQLITSTATSVDVERLFSRGRLLLSHVRSRLSAQSTRALLCLSFWSKLNLVKTDDVLNVSSLPDVEGDEEELENGWDDIIIE